MYVFVNFTLYISLEKKYIQDSEQTVKPGKYLKPVNLNL